MSGRRRPPRAGDAPPVTLADLAAEGRRIWAWCNACGHNGTLGAQALIERLGAQFPVPEVGQRLRCDRCGGGDIDARPDWPRGPVTTSHKWHKG